MLRPARPLDLASGRAAAFLDRDGVLNEAVPDPASGLLESPLEVKDVHLLPGAAKAAGRLRQAGYALICVSNQPAAAKGKATVAELQAVHERVLDLLAQEGVSLEASYLCMHHPEGTVPELSRRCDCRKPSPGLLHDAVDGLALNPSRSWMFGDTDSDVQAGRAAGCRTVLIEYPDTAHKRSGRSGPDLRARDLFDGVAQLLDYDGG
ncbi:MAG TPA: HAD-IIIA family hydrolase [Solirubrobacteraceae bacterium]|nr:HAD-IIIA family hydrolase [Solirubrobacteraceae bacterium]